MAPLTTSYETCTCVVISKKLLIGALSVASPHHLPGCFHAYQPNVAGRWRKVHYDKEARVSIPAKAEVHAVRERWLDLRDAVERHRLPCEHVIVRPKSRFVVHRTPTGTLRSFP